MPIRYFLLNFGRRLRADPRPRVPNPGHTRPPPNNGAQPDPPDQQTVLSQWQHLGLLDPTSRDYVELLGTLVDVEGNRKLALNFTDNDAGIVINIIGDALGCGDLHSKLAGRAFCMLRKLAGNTGRLPDSYLVSENDDYQVEEPIFACGGFADVRKGKLAEKVVAVKTIRIAQDSNMSRIRKDFCKESVLWMHTSHPNLLNLIAVSINPQTEALSMISEMMDNGNIMDYIRVREANRIHLLRDVAKGLQYLHERKIVHGDLKGSNILITNGTTPQACISDFGFSNFTPTMSFAMPASVDESKGTRSHMAPELLYPRKFGFREGRVSEQADVYAFGMVVYEVLTGRPPWGERRQPEVTLRVIEGKRPSKPETAGDIGFGGGTWELVQQCWERNRDERPTAEKIVEHFHRVAETSRDVPPGPTVPAREYEHTTASESESGSGDTGYSRLFIASSQPSMTIVQHVKFVTDLMAGSTNVHSHVELVRAKPSLFNRLGARIKGQRPALRLAAPPVPPARA